MGSAQSTKEARSCKRWEEVSLHGTEEEARLRRRREEFRLRRRREQALGEQRLHRWINDSASLDSNASVAATTVLSETFTEKFAKSLECPICFNDISAPIYQCPNGHVLCNTCQARVNICPVCRSMPLSFRCRVLEELAESYVESKRGHMQLQQEAAVLPPRTMISTQNSTGGVGSTNFTMNVCRTLGSTAKAGRVANTPITSNITSRVANASAAPSSTASSVNLRSRLASTGANRAAGALTASSSTTNMRTASTPSTSNSVGDANAASYSTGRDTAPNRPHDTARGPSADSAKAMLVYFVSILLVCILCW